MILSKKTKAMYAPIQGEIMALDHVPDLVFSSKMMGDGFAIHPTDGKVYSPFDCQVVLVFETGHALGLKTKDGIEVLIHFGLDTVKLKGEGFDIKVTEGMKVKQGHLLMEVDMAAIKDRVPSLITPIIFTSGADFKLEGQDQVSVGDRIISF